MNETTAKSQKQKAISVVRNANMPDVLGGVILVASGLILLLNNIGVIPWSIWTYIFPFWPVIFIFIGLDIISENSPLLKLLTTLIGLVILAFIVCYGLTATDYRFRNYLYKHFPLWSDIYQSVPQKSILDLNEMFEVTPDKYRLDRRGNMRN